MSVIRQWLPASEVEAAVLEGPRRFRGIFKALKADWVANEGLDPGTRCVRTLEWLSLVASLDVEAHKPALTSDDINQAVEVMLEIVFFSESSVAARARWADELTAFLMDYRSKVTITIPWRPIYQIIGQNLQENCGGGFVGPLVKSQEVTNLTSLAKRARRFFPPGSAAEIWEEVRPRLQETNQTKAYAAVGWLALMMPTREVKNLDADWNAWLGDWMDAWESVVHSNFWDSLWLTLLARLAKHDTEGVIQWQPYLPRILTKCLWAFQVPVGSAGATPPFGRKAPESINAIFHQIVTKRSPKVAKLLIWLLGRVNEPAVGESLREEDTVLLALERLGNLLEQYYHPSNNGKWTSTLGFFLERLTKHLGTRTRFEQSPGRKEGNTSDDEEPLPSALNGYAGGRGLATHPRAPLSDDTQRRVAKLIVKMASKAQYAKDRDLVAKACYAMARMAVWIPETVLPLVHSRFQMALEAVTAAHQLAIAVHTLGLCTRALLLAGLSLPEGAAEETETSSIVPTRVAAMEAVKAALNATLPGIDANDERKTQAVFRLHCIVLSSIGNLERYTEDWLDELLARVFALLTNLDSPEALTDQQKAFQSSNSFLVQEDCMFRPLIELLLNRLPDDLKAHAIKRIGRFVTSNTLLTVGLETSFLCEEASKASPKDAVKYLAEPLIAKVEAEIPSLKRTATSASSGGPHISKVQECSISWQLWMLGGTLMFLGDQILPLKARIVNILEAIFSLPFQKLAEQAGELLTAVLHCTCQYYTVDDAAATEALAWTQDEGTPVEAWISVEGCNVPQHIANMKPHWHEPNCKEVALADELLQKHLLGAARQLRAYCEGKKELPPGFTEKHLVQLLLDQMTSGIQGAMSGLPDFEHDGPSLEGEDLSIKAMAGARVGSSAMRLEVGQALLVASRHRFVDPEIQQQLMKVVDMLLSSGYEEHLDYDSHLGIWRADDMFLKEDRTDFRLHQQPGKWKFLRPRKMQVMRAQLLLMHRVAEARFRSQATSSFPTPPLTWVPTIYKDLCVELLQYGLSNYRAVAAQALKGLTRAAKQYPCLVEPLLPTVLSALGGLPLPSQEEVLDKMHSKRRGQHSPIEPHMDMDLLMRLANRAITASTEHTLTIMEATAADLSIEEGQVGGAIQLLMSMPFWRPCTRYLEPQLGLMAALLASSSHRSPNIMTSIQTTFSLLLLRVLRPPGTEPPLPENREYLEAMQQLLLKLGSASPEKPVNWKYSLMANGLLLMSLPPISTAATATLARHFFPVILHQQSFQCHTAAIFFIGVLDGRQCWSTAEMREVTASVVREGLAADPEWGRKFLERFCHNHVTPAEQATSSGRMRTANKETALVDVVRTTILRPLDWPHGRPVPTAVQDHSFSLIHTQLIIALTKAASQQMIASLKSWITTALAGIPEREHLPRTLMAIEALAALICSGALFSPKDGSSEWEQWAKSLLASALEVAPLDYGDAWAAALRYCLHRLAEQSLDGFKELLSLLLNQRPKQGAGSVAQVRWLKILGHVLCELNSLNVLGCKSHKSPLKTAGQAFQQEALSILPTFMQSHTSDARRYAASCIVVLLTSLLPAYEMSTLTVDGTAMDISDDLSESKLTDNARSLLHALVQAVHDGSQLIAAVERQAGETSGLPKDPQLLQSSTIARLGMSLQVINQSMRGAEGLSAVAMRPILLKMLGPLLKMQEMASPELQPLALEAKSAAATLKYLPVADSQISEVVATLQEVSQHDQWPARASALVFAQYFWFRHIFQMSPQQSRDCQDLVICLMRDKKLEVQELAALTLSGMLKSLSESDFNALREKFLQQAEQLFPKRHKRLKTGAVAVETTTVSEKHSLVLGLKAFVLCTPYDVPQWLPETLMALVQASTQPPPIKQTVKKTLSEFKRTHEHTGLSEVKASLTSDQWEAIQGIASPASYFA